MLSGVREERLRRCLLPGAACCWVLGCGWGGSPGGGQNVSLASRLLLYMRSILNMNIPLSCHCCSQVVWTRVHMHAHSTHQQQIR